MVFALQKRDVADEDEDKPLICDQEFLPGKPRQDQCDEEDDALGISLGDRDPVTQKSTKRGKKRKRNEDAEEEKEFRKSKRKEMQKAEMEAPKKVVLVVGVDHGTTYSGKFMRAAYRSNADSPNNGIKYIDRWPGNSGELTKAPSSIAYASENIMWGPANKTLQSDVASYEVKPGMKSYTWWKLRLDEHADPTEYDDPLLSIAVGKGVLRLPPGKTAVDVTGDYMRIFLKTIKAELAKRLGKALIDSTPIEFWCTVPAIWDDRAQDRTERALKQAGFFERKIDKVCYVSEPEAAAVAALKKWFEQNPNSLKENMRVIVADIGGGTVDVEAMQVLSLSPLKLKTVGVGAGGKCGATTVHRKFIAWMQSTFGEAFAKITETKKCPGSPVMVAFEDAMRAFEGNLDDNHTIPFPALAQQLRSRKQFLESFDDDEGGVLIQGEEMKGFFSDTVEQTCKLIQKQAMEFLEIDAAKQLKPDVVILAGGLSNSQYIFQELSRFCHLNFGDNIEVLRPENAWGAISYGAVEYGLDRTVTISRVARRHYFITVQEAFREGIDQEQRAVMIPKYGKRVKGCLQMLMQKGEIIRDKQKKYFRDFIMIDDTSPGALVYSYKIMYSNADQPPKYEDDPACRRIGELKIDLNPVVQSWAKKGFSGWNFDASKNPVRVNVNIVVSGGHGAGIMHIAANADRKNVGELVMDYSSSIVEAT